MKCSLYIGVLTRSADGHLLVTEAGPNAVSSYAVGGDGKPNQVAPCWMAVAGQFGYAANAHSNSVTGYHVAGDGTLTALNGSGITGTTGDGPLDDAVTADGTFPYVLSSHDDAISSFRINADADGSLSKRPDLPGFAAHSRRARRPLSKYTRKRAAPLSRKRGGAAPSCRQLVCAAGLKSSAPGMYMNITHSAPSAQWLS
jgi:hypothetical protein